MKESVRKPSDPGHDQVGRVLEAVGPHHVHEMLQGVLAAEAVHPERKVLAGPGGRLPAPHRPYSLYMP